MLFSALLAGTALAQTSVSGPAVMISARARAATPLPACDTPYALSLIAQKFAYQDRRILLTGLVIDHIDSIGERGLRLGAPGFVDRRYCGATAWLSNGLPSELVYLIEGPRLGPFSFRWGVQSCLPGFDPYRVYSADCRAIRP